MPYQVLEIVRVNRSVFETVLRPATETTCVEKHSQSFMEKNGRKGDMYAETVEWVSPTGGKANGIVLINAKTYMGTVWGKLLQTNLLILKIH